MRVFIILMSLYLFVSCRENEMQFPDISAIPNMAAPVYLKTDTVEIDLKDYFQFPGKVKKIRSTDGLQISWNKDQQTVGLFAVDSLKSFFNVSFRYDGYVYDIPVIRQDRVLSRDSLQIRTNEIKGDTICLNSTGNVDRWVVYLENFRLPEKVLCQEPDRLGFVIPFGAAGIKSGNLRIWAFNGQGCCQGLSLPFAKGRLIMNIQELDTLKNSMKPWIDKVNRYDLTCDTNCRELVRLLGIKAIEDTSEVKHCCVPDRLSEDHVKNVLSESMALIFGDYIPLRKDKYIYAYMRSYFGLEWIVVANRGEEMVTLKLDLPRKHRNVNFKAFFGNRFSYGNSKLIVDVPARRAEVVYN